MFKNVLHLILYLTSCSLSFMYGMNKCTSNSNSNSNTIIINNYNCDSYLYKMMPYLFID
jgi:hypothetical protein